MSQQFVGSEFRKIQSYLQENSTATTRKKKKIVDKVVEILEPGEQIIIPYRKWFDFVDVSTINIQPFIDSVLTIEVKEDLRYNRAFFTSGEVTGCKRRLFYQVKNFDFTVTQEFIKNYIQHLTFQNNRKILLEILNFEFSNIVVENEQVKAIVFGYHKNCLYDFCHKDEIDKGKIESQLKCHLLRLKERLITQICLFVIGDSIDDVAVLKFNYNKLICDDLLKKLDNLVMDIKTDIIPPIEERSNCINCIYKDNCKKKSTIKPKQIEPIPEVIQEPQYIEDEGVEVIEEYEDPKKPNKKNTFLL